LIAGIIFEPQCVHDSEIQPSHQHHDRTHSG